MCWSKKSSKHQGLKKPALSAHHGSPRTACFPPAPIRANGASVHGVNGHPVSDPPAANWNVQAARAMATDPLTATVRRVVTGIVPSHRVRIAQAGTVHRVVTGIGLRALVVRPSNQVVASRLAEDHPVGVADLRVVADHQAEAALRVVLVRHGVILKQGSATCGLSPDGSKAVL